MWHQKTTGAITDYKFLVENISKTIKENRQYSSVWSKLKKSSNQVYEALHKEKPKYNKGSTPYAELYKCNAEPWNGLDR